MGRGSMPNTNPSMARPGFTLLLAILGGCAGPLDRSLYPRTCQIHGTSLRPDTVKVVYGLVDSFPEEEQAQATQFPNSNSFGLGGCSRSPWAPGLTRVMY